MLIHVLSNEHWGLSNSYWFVLSHDLSTLTFDPRMRSCRQKTRRQWVSFWLACSFMFCLMNIEDLVILTDLFWVMTFQLWPLTLEWEAADRKQEDSGRPANQYDFPVFSTIFQLKYGHTIFLYFNTFFPKIYFFFALSGFQLHVLYMCVCCVRECAIPSAVR